MKPGPRAAIAPFLAMEMAREAAARAAAGRKIVRFDVGQPCFSAPEAALAAAERALRADPLGYTDALGLPALRNGIAQYYADQYAVEVDPARIVITQGASGAFQLAFLALLADGDRLAMASPGYPPYRHILAALGFRAALAEAGPEDRCQLTPRLLRELANQGPLAGALVASPANPSGTMLDRNELSALLDAARSLALPLIVDEIYHGLVYDDREWITALALDPAAIVINSFSKFWSMTGWRVGWMVAPDPLIKPIERLAQNLFISPPGIGQVAALAALGATAQCKSQVERLAANRRLLLNELPGLGLPIVSPPDGAFYCLLDVSAHADDSEKLCRRLLLEADVALTPGLDFCETRGSRWVRLAYMRAFEEIELGLERLARALR